MPEKTDRARSTAEESELLFGRSRAERWFFGDVVKTPARAKFHIGWSIVTFLIFFYNSMSFYPPEGGASTFFFVAHVAFTVFLIPFAMAIYVKYHDLREQGFYDRQAQKRRAREERAQRMLAFARRGSGRARG
ncbi:hypothetical protein ACFP47_01745 [Nesterenkonia lacusekhoensis]|uniref:DUF1003 domain-containing protein n=1 Tax=Nesterenkonia lacusekhoensis TaxID=150832 RepID=A0ABS4T5J2_9MICC|nr:hypothetical protein [Nesterenkonia lacusekhoensis]MBP2319430.1 hypothetical protein [Nesterenkonia lacusekhoensis]